MFIGRLAKLADHIAAPVTAHPPGPMPLDSRAQRRPARSRLEVLAAHRTRRMA